MRSIYIVASGQDVGKTTMSVGLIGLLQARGLRVRFLKPVGQQYVVRDQLKIDKDSVLMQAALGMEGALADMSPITVPSGFVEQYLFHRDVTPLKRRIREAYERLTHDCDVLIVEGTGHAGVGSCFDLSNAEVAALIDARALLVAEGGIGSTLDEVALNHAVFQVKRVPVLGVLANKIFPEKLERIRQALGQGLTHMGLELFGAVPFDARLTYPRVGQIGKVLGAEMLCGEPALDNRIHHVLVADMEPQNVIPRLEPHTLMITSGDRIDNILVAINSGLYRGEGRRCVEGIVLTGGLIPHFTIVALLKESGLPVLLCKDGTYPVSARVQRTVHKIQPEDTDKIEQAQRLVREHVNAERLLAALDRP